MKAKMEKIEEELNYFGQQYDKAKAEYDFVKEIFEDVFESAKLQQEIHVLERFSTTFCKI